VLGSLSYKLYQVCLTLKDFILDFIEKIVYNVVYILYKDLNCHSKDIGLGHIFFGFLLIHLSFMGTRLNMWDSG
jgi:hypothetical protein